LNKIDELELMLVKLGYSKNYYKVGLHILLSKEIHTFKHMLANESSSEQLYNNKAKSEERLNNEMPYIYDNIVNIYVQGEELEIKTNHQFIDTLITSCFEYDDEERTVLHKGKYVSYWTVRDYYEKDLNNLIELLSIFHAKLSEYCTDYESIKRATLLFETGLTASLEDLASIANSIKDADAVGFNDFIKNTAKLGIKIKDYKEALNVYNSIS
jgi:hypothetical protein